MTQPEAPLYDPCEDCMATGGQRDEDGAGTCTACGGEGRRPANQAARVVLRQKQAAHDDYLYERARREVDER